jgi:hypothetical protein
MHEILLGLLVLGLLALGRSLVLPAESPVINMTVSNASADVVHVIPLGTMPSGPLDPLWVDQEIVSLPEKYQRYPDDGIFGDLK